MTFAAEPVRIPVRIAAIEVCLYSPDPLGVEVSGANYSAQVVYSTGEVRALTGNLVPHLTQAQVNSLLNFMSAIRAKAETEILP